jgi:hypothetical protein
MADDYRGEERRRRWPIVPPREERRAEPLTFLETDQEPDQSPPGMETMHYCRNSSTALLNSSSIVSEAQCPPSGSSTSFAPGIFRASSSEK